MSTSLDWQRLNKKNRAAERMFHTWDEALSRLEELPEERLDEGVEALLPCYATDASIESPLIHDLHNKVAKVTQKVS